MPAHVMRQATVSIDEEGGRWFARITGDTVVRALNALAPPERTNRYGQRAMCEPWEVKGSATCGMRPPQWGSDGLQETRSCEPLTL